jgi:hypothetical protein
VKELRLRGIAAIDEANRFLPGFVADYNGRFAKPPRNPKDLHRRPAPHDDLDGALAWREERTVSNSLTLQYDKVLFLLEPSAITRELRGKRVTVVDYPDGRLAIRHQGVDLPYSIFDKLRRVPQAAVVDNERLGAVLEHIRGEQLRTEQRRSQGAPRRRGQADPMFGVG